MLTTAVTRAQTGQRTPLETLPTGCGQPFLVGHPPPGLPAPPSEREPLSVRCRRLMGALGTDSRAHGAAVPSGSHPHPPTPTSRFPAYRAHPRCPPSPLQPLCPPTHARALSVVALLSSPLLSSPLPPPPRGCESCCLGWRGGRASAFALPRRASLHLMETLLTACR